MSAGCVRRPEARAGWRDQAASPGGRELAAQPRCALPRARRRRAGERVHSLHPALQLSYITSRQLNWYMPRRSGAHVPCLPISAAAVPPPAAPAGASSRPPPVRHTAAPSLAAVRSRRAVAAVPPRPLLGPVPAHTAGRWEGHWACSASRWQRATAAQPPRKAQPTLAHLLSGAAWAPAAASSASEVPASQQSQSKASGS